MFRRTYDPGIGTYPARARRYRDVTPRGSSRRAPVSLPLAGRSRQPPRPMACQEIWGSKNAGLKVIFLLYRKILVRPEHSLEISKFHLSSRPQTGSVGLRSRALDLHFLRRVYPRAKTLGVVRAPPPCRATLNCTRFAGSCQGGETQRFISCRQKVLLSFAYALFSPEINCSMHQLLQLLLL